MNDQTTPADPFDSPAEEQQEQDNSNNATGYAALRREIMAETLDTGVGDPDRWTCSQHWSELDHLALTRACIWIVHADGYGVGITPLEAAALASRNPDTIPTTARRIIRRLSEIVAAPEAEGQAVSGSEALAGIIPAINT